MGLDWLGLPVGRFYYSSDWVLLCPTGQQRESWCLQMTSREEHLELQVAGFVAFGMYMCARKRCPVCRRAPGRSAIDVTHRNVPIIGQAWWMAKQVYLQLVLIVYSLIK